ncbi:MAG: DNA repair protein RecO [Xanthomonadales bacterium]|nr:DNA repair protein RecO [Xanthomonadales bacterium]
MSQRSFMAFVLHRRPWRENSFLLELLSPDQGRVGVVARGASGRKNNWRQCLQPFRPLQVFVSGKGELANLNQAEEVEAWAPFQGDALYCGLYMNELTMRLLPRNDIHPELFQSYQLSLRHLKSATNLGVPLRYFEMSLLSALGFGLQLEHEAESEAPVAADAFYRYDPEAGPRRTQLSNAYAGDSLLALAQQQLSTARQRRDAKRLLQQALAPHLGNKPLVSRQLMKRR